MRIAHALPFYDLKMLQDKFLRNVLSQISQAPPPISHSDHCHLSFKPPAPHQHSIKPALLKHTPHLSQLSDLAYTKWTHTYSTQLLTSRLLASCSCSSLVLHVSYVCLSSSVTPAHLRCWSEVCAQPHHPRVPGKKTIISRSFNILSTSRYLLTILPCLPDC